MPVKLKGPVSKTHPSKLKLALPNERLKCSLLEKELPTRRSKIKTKAVNLPSDIRSFFDNTIDGTNKIDPFIKIFGGQQKTVFSKENGAKVSSYDNIENTSKP